MDSIPAASGAAVLKKLDYETFFVDDPGGAVRPDPPTARPWLLAGLEAILATGAAGRAATARTANRRYQAPGHPIRVAEPAFVLVSADTLTDAGISPAGGTTYSDVLAALNGAPGQRDVLQIVATHEMAAA